MNLSGTITCLNCGKPMKQGSTNLGIDMIQFRYCECGLKMFLFTEAKGFEYSLTREPKSEDV